MQIDKAEVKKDASWLAARLKEPSTYAGLAAVAAVFHMGIPPDALTAITQIGTGVGGLLAVFLAENKA
jgi:DMSO reductase anchor subunit